MHGSREAPPRHARIRRGAFTATSNTPSSRNAGIRRACHDEPESSTVATHRVDLALDLIHKQLAEPDVDVFERRKKLLGETPPMGARCQLMSEIHGSGGSIRWP